MDLCVPWTAVLSVCLVTTTVAETTTGCTFKEVHIVGTTVPYFDVSGEATAISIFKTHRSADLTICHCWVCSSYPAGCISVTPGGCGWTGRSHFCTCWTFKPEPSRTKSTVTFLITIVSVRHLSVWATEVLVILAFWLTEKKIIQAINKLERKPGHVIFGDL